MIQEENCNFVKSAITDLFLITRLSEKHLSSLADQLP